MSLFENFPFTNLHQLNLNWLIEEVKKCYSPDNPPEAMVISVNGESGVVTLYKNAHVALPDITEEQWNFYRGTANKITGIEFNKDAPATRINGNQRFVIYDAGNPPPYPVLAVNGETGNVILYEEPYVVFPDVEGDNWGLERKLNTDTADETRIGIMFDDTGKAYITHDEDATQLLTIEDIPSSSGVVSVNGETGVVNLTGSDIPASATDNRSVQQLLSLLDQTEQNNIISIDNIRKTVAYNETGTEATHNIPKDGYLFWNGVCYTANSNISIGDTLTTQNLTEVDVKGLSNILSTDIVNIGTAIDNINTAINNINDNFTNYTTYITFGDSSKNITQNLTDYWSVNVPNDSQTHLVRINAQYGMAYGIITRYASNYGICLILRYDNSMYAYFLNSGIVTEKRVSLT